MFIIQIILGMSLQYQILTIAFFSILTGPSYADGKCSETDRTFAIHHDNLDFVKNWEACGRLSFGIESYFTKCLQEKHTGVSTDCINCFTQFVSCTKKNCWFKCTGLTPSLCEPCATEYCMNYLATCTGVKREDLPSKYTNKIKL